MIYKLCQMIKKSKTVCVCLNFFKELLRMFLTDQIEEDDLMQHK